MDSDENLQEHPEEPRRIDLPEEESRRAELPELEFDLSVTFVSSEEFNAPNDEDVRDSTDPWENPDLLPIDEETRQRLLELEPEVLQWLSASAANAEAFARDPIEALSLAQPDIDSVTPRYMYRHRGTQRDKIALLSKVRHIKGTEKDT